MRNVFNGNFVLSNLYYIDWLYVVSEKKKIVPFSISSYKQLFQLN